MGLYWVGYLKINTFHMNSLSCAPSLQLFTKMVPLVLQSLSL